MSRKLTIKQEAFVLAYIETGNASEAYRRAYNTARMKPETIRRNAFALLENNNITTTIEKLQAEHRERHDVTVDSLTADARDAIALAKKAGRASAYVSALTLIAKLHGKLPDRHNVNVTTETEIVSLDDATDAQLIAAVLESKSHEELYDFCCPKSLNS